MTHTKGENQLTNEEWEKRLESICEATDFSGYVVRPYIVPVLKSFIAQELSTLKAQIKDDLSNYYLIRKPLDDRKVIKLWVEFDRDTETTTNRGYAHVIDGVDYSLLILK